MGAVVSFLHKVDTLGFKFFIEAFIFTIKFSSLSIFHHVTHTSFSQYLCACETMSSYPECQVPTTLSGICPRPSSASWLCVCVCVDMSFQDEGLAVGHTAT